MPSAGVTPTKHDLQYQHAKAPRGRCVGVPGKTTERVMNRTITIGLSMLAGAALGALGIHSLHAQAKPPIYYISEIDVSNPDAYGREYATNMQALIKAHGGRQLAIGGVGGAGAAKVTAFDGDAPKRGVVQLWDSMEKIQAWRSDPKFKELRQIGEKYAKFRSFAVEGVSQ
jgi:uncharacterized protein (DUF1330 family)